MNADRSAFYADPEQHAACAAIVLRRSVHPGDARLAAIAGLDLSRARDVLDLGCGPGITARLVVPSCAPDAHVVGVDAWEANEIPFRAAVDGLGRKASFVATTVHADLPWPSRSFDLVLATWSLYWFADVLPEIARVLRAEGIFVTITHSRDELSDLACAMGLDASESPFARVIRTFSAEDAGCRLEPWFAEIERIEFPNALEFGPEHARDLADYSRFKLPFVVPPDREGRPEDLVETVLAHHRERGGMRLGKSDAIFRCRRPVCP